MKKEFLIVLVCVLGIALFVFRDVFSSSDEKAVERVLDRIEEQIEFSDALKPLNAVSRLNSLKKLIHQEIIIEISIAQFQREVSGFDSIKAGALYGSRKIHSSSISRLPTQIQIHGNTALVDFYVIASAIDSSGENLRERFQVNAHLSKNDGNWTLSEIAISQNRNN